MSYTERHTLTITTSGTSTANDFTPRVTGALHSIGYRVGTTAYSTVCTVTITVEATSQTLFNSTAFNSGIASLTVPRVPLVNTAGTTIAGEAQIALANDRINVLVAAVGANKNGTFDLFIN